MEELRVKSGGHGEEDKKGAGRVGEKRKKKTRGEEDEEIKGFEIKIR